MPRPDPTLDDQLPDLLSPLSHEERRVLSMMLGGMPFKEIAAQVGMDVSSIYRIRRKPSFEKALLMIQAWEIGQLARQLYADHRRVLARLDEMLWPSEQPRGKGGKFTTKQPTLNQVIQALGIYQRIVATAPKIQAAAELSQMRDDISRIAQVSAAVVDAMTPSELRDSLAKRLAGGG